jgi:hypothetical protein
LETPYLNRRAGRAGSVTLAAFFIAAPLGISSAAAAVKKVSYPEVKVEIVEPYRPDAAFEAMSTRFSAAVAKKDEQALFALIGPNFVWTLEGSLTDEFDLGRDTLHNFKVVFGFRELGKNTDGNVADGPFWGALAAFAQDKTYYKASDSGGLICGPIKADIANEDTLEAAQKKIAPGDDDQVDWYFTLGDTSVAKAPGDSGPPVGKVGKVALPVLSTAPAAKPGEPAPQPAFLEVLLPSGKTGWIPAAAAKQLAADHLCYAKTVSGEWKIVAYDQPE